MNKAWSEFLQAHAEESEATQTDCALNDLSHFGLIQVEWPAKPPLVSLQIRDVDGRIVLQERLRLSDLRP